MDKLPHARWAVVFWEAKELGTKQENWQSKVNAHFAIRVYLRPLFPEMSRQKIRLAIQRWVWERVFTKSGSWCNESRKSAIHSRQHSSTLYLTRPNRRPSCLYLARWSLLLENSMLSYHNQTASHFVQSDKAHNYPPLSKNVQRRKERAYANKWLIRSVKVQLETQNSA